MYYALGYLIDCGYCLRTFNVEFQYFTNGSLKFYIIYIIIFFSSSIGPLSDPFVRLLLFSCSSSPLLFFRQNSIILLALPILQTSLIYPLSRFLYYYDGFLISYFLVCIYIVKNDINSSCRLFFSFNSN